MTTTYEVIFMRAEAEREREREREIQGECV